MGLGQRLKHADGIRVAADVSVAGLLGGQFGGLHVVGQRWITPLDLTAERIEVRRGAGLACSMCMQCAAAHSS